MMQDYLTDPEQFDETVRLFPLPGLVFFPHGVQPLHIFEPRYRQMTADALAGDQHIALVLLGDDWEKNYDAKPTIHQVACLGRIVADQLLPDGRYNLLLRGVHRVRIIEEIECDKLYRVARVKLMTDEVPDDIAELMRVRNLLAEMMIPRFRDEQIRTQVAGLFKGEIPLGRLCDILAFALPMPQQLKQDLLESTCVLSRAKLLMAGFNDIVENQPELPNTDRKFPPEFSDN